MSEVTYAHCADPKGARFTAPKESLLPGWAVDVKDVDPCLNAYGLPFHNTDTYIHWTEKEPVIKMKKLREAYEALTKGDKSLVKHLETLMQAAYDSGSDDQRDDDDDDGF